MKVQNIWFFGDDCTEVRLSDEDPPRVVIWQTLTQQSSIDSVHLNLEIASKVAEAIQAAVETIRGPAADVSHLIQPGEFTLVFPYTYENLDPFKLRIRFSWDGGSSAAFVLDAWVDPDEPLFMEELNSDPISGWATWINGRDVLIAYARTSTSEEGWARVAGAAPGEGGTSDAENRMGLPESWLQLARVIADTTYDGNLQAVSRQVYS